MGLVEVEQEEEEVVQAIRGVRPTASSSLGRCRLTEAMLLLLAASVAVAGNDMMTDPLWLMSL